MSMRAHGFRDSLSVESTLSTRLDYYSHTAFEITSDQLGIRPLCAVGSLRRSDQPVRGPTPAIGWAIGMERLLLVLEAAAYTDPMVLRHSCNDVT